MMDPRYEEYAQLVVRMGLNVRKGQTVILRAPVECAPLARLCAKAAYDAGCAQVVVSYIDSETKRMRYLYADDAVFDACADWEVAHINGPAQAGAGFLTIYADDPNSLLGVDPSRIARDERIRGEATRPYMDAIMHNRARWCLVSAPVPAWAQKVYPNMAPDEAMRALWEAIFQTMRITGDGKALERWQAHDEQMHARMRRLNELKIRELTYRNGLGTDLTIGLPDGAVWAGGSEAGADGVPFIANMPTEEIFTAPHRERVTGRVVASMPLVLSGNVIESFALTFERGRIVGIEARDERERKLLEDAIAVDEGAAYLGEVALVGKDSPITQLGILFYNTLFDENASCHLAFGKAYPCVEGAQDMSDEELAACGLNDSLTHVDFMIGTPDLSITATTASGDAVDVFTNGAFSL